MKPKTENKTQPAAETTPAPAVDTFLIQAQAGRLSQTALADARDLARLAEQDEVAAETLHTLASQVAEMWIAYCSAHEDRAARFLPRKSGFPCNWPVFRKDRERLDSWVERLRLGISGTISLGAGRQRDLDKLPMEIAVNWVTAIQKALVDLRIGRLKAALEESHFGEPYPTHFGLPEGASADKADEWRRWQSQVLELEDKPFTAANSKAWAEVIWSAILLLTDGRPESQPELSKVGRYRAQHSVQRGAQKKTTPKTSASDTRDGIKTRITDAVRKLARGKSAPA